MLKTLTAQIKEYKKDSLLSPLYVVLEAVMEMIIPYIMSAIIDQGVTAANMSAIYKYGALMIVAAACGLLFGLLGAKTSARASAGFAKNIRYALYDHVQDFSFKNIDKYSTPGLITRLTTDVSNLQSAFLVVIRMMVRAPASLIIAMAMTFLISARLALIYLAAAVVLGIIMYFLITAANKHFQIVFDQYDSLNSSVQENLTGIRVVKSFAREDYEKDKFRRANQKLYTVFVKAERVVSWTSPVMNATVYTCILLISWFGAHMIVSNTLTTGELMSVLTYCMNILMSLMMLSMVMVMITMSAASARRIAEVLNEKPDIADPDSAVTEVADGSIAFHHVDFSYSGRPDHLALRDIDFSVKPGETIGILGATGSGKTSLVNLINRMYDVTSGTLEVGGQDVRNYDLEAFRDAVSVVLQKNELFSGTVEENLRWGKSDASLEDCRRACRLACADEFIEKLPDGYQTKVERGGANFSGGQKQRLCIARALMKNPKILILDDSTSAVDTATDARIRKAFKEEVPQMTKIIIAQRIASVQDADRIIVMQNGSIGAIGSHDRLLQTSAVYRDIYEAQTLAGGDFDEGGDA